MYRCKLKTINVAERTATYALEGLVVITLDEAAVIDTAFAKDGPAYTCSLDQEGFVCHPALSFATITIDIEFEDQGVVDRASMARAIEPKILEAIEVAKARKTALLGQAAAINARARPAALDDFDLIQQSLDLQPVS